MTAGRSIILAVAAAAVLAGCGDNTADNKTAATVVGADVATPTITEDKDEVELQMYYYERIDKFLIVQRKVRDGIVIDVEKTVVGVNYTSTDTSELAGEIGVSLLERF
jgi:hypothetical protein